MAKISTQNDLRYSADIPIGVHSGMALCSVAKRSKYRAEERATRGLRIAIPRPDLVESGIM